MQIRRLRASDAVAYRALRLRAFREHPDAFTSDFEAESQKPRASDIELLVLTFTSSNQHVESLYRRAGFVPFGIEPGAIKVDNQKFDKTHMYLPLSSS